MGEREGRGVLLYLLLDVASDEQARDLAAALGDAMADVDERFVGYAVSEVEPVQLTFEAEGGSADNDTSSPRGNKG